MKKILYAQAKIEKEEIDAVVSVMENGWIGFGEKGLEFEKEMCLEIGCKYGAMVNSGSSANFLAIAYLKEFFDDGEIITCACGFPTTLSVIIQNGFTPVVIDAELGTYNPDISMLSSCLSNKTRAVFFANTLGNPNELQEIEDFCKNNCIFFIQDNCDAVGSKYNNISLGHYGDISTISFYPAHHMMVGQGGFVGSNNKDIIKKVKEFRSWGMSCASCDHMKDCYTKENGFCNNRFADHFNMGYALDKRYCFSTMGYNFGSTDLAAAIGLAQVKKLDLFKEKRKENFTKLYNIFMKYNDLFILPKWLPHADVSWFAFPLTVKKDVEFTKNEFVMHLEKNGILSRMIFGGNLLRHPAFINQNIKVVGNLDNSDMILTNSFFIGCHPHMTEEDIIYIENVVDNFIGSLK